MLFQKARQTYRIRKNRCPYCKTDFVLADIFDGTFWVPAKLCPAIHFAILFNMGIPTMDALHINYQMLDLGGQPIPLPDEFIKFREEMIENLK